MQSTKKECNLDFAILQSQSCRCLISDVCVCVGAGAIVRCVTMKFGWEEEFRRSKPPTPRVVILFGFWSPYLKIFGNVKILVSKNIKHWEMSSNFLIGGLIPLILPASNAYAKIEEILQRVVRDT